MGLSVYFATIYNIVSVLFMAKNTGTRVSRYAIVVQLLWNIPAQIRILLSIGKRLKMGMKYSFLLDNLAARAYSSLCYWRWRTKWIQISNPTKLTELHSISTSQKGFIGKASLGFVNQCFFIISIRISSKHTKHCMAWTNWHLNITSDVFNLKKSEMPLEQMSFSFGVIAVNQYFVSIAVRI